MEEQAAAARVARADQLLGGGSSGSAAGGDPAMAAALAELERFHGSEELTLAFAPAALTSDQRNLVRMKAVALGYKGKSKGGGQARHLVINKPGAVKKDERTWQQRRRGGEAQSELQPESELGPSLVSGDNEDPNSSVVFLRKIPRSVGRLELMALGAQFGKVADTVLLHGRGQCVLQFESTAEATAFLSHYAEQPLVMNGKKLLCQRGAADISRTPVVMHRHILREVHHVLDDIVRKLVTAEAAENRRNRHKRQKRHRKLLKEQRLASRGLLHDSEVAALNGGGGGAGGGESAGAGADQIRHDICWDFVKSGGKCYRGDSCQYTHEMVPLHQIPVKLRFLMSEDTFPESREINPEKAAVNQTLAELSADVPNRRCLVLDGATCSSVRVLRGMGAEDSESAAGSRQASDVVVPNVVTTTFLEIQKLQICEAFHGSLRVYMDSHPVRKPLFFYPVSDKTHDQFTKTGSGQTHGELKRRGVFGEPGGTFRSNLPRLLLQARCGQVRCGDVPNSRSRDALPPWAVRSFWLRARDHSREGGPGGRWSSRGRRRCEEAAGQRGGGGGGCSTETALLGDTSRCVTWSGRGGVGAAVFVRWDVR